MPDGDPTPAPVTGRASGPAPGAPLLAAVAGALLGGTGVALAALGAHLPALAADPHREAVFQEGVRMQMWHALALLASSALLGARDRLALAAVVAMIAGTLLFAAGVDGASLGARTLEPLAPLGGTTLIVAWFVLAAALVRGRARGAAAADRRTGRAVRG